MPQACLAGAQRVDVPPFGMPLTVAIFEDRGRMLEILCPESEVFKTHANERE